MHLTTRTETLVATRHPEPVTDTRFIYALEQAPLLPALLYNELLPRRRPWVSKVENLLPSVEGASLSVPVIELDAQSLALDGRLDKPLWTELGSREANPPAGCAGVPLAGGARMVARCARDGLLLGFDFPRGVGAPTTLALAWLSEFAIPAESSGYTRVNVFRDRAPEGRRFRGRQEMPWSCDWRAACARTDRGLQWEVLIPVATASEWAQRLSAVPWRLNAAALEESSSGSVKTVARWGFPELTEVLHGVRFVLRNGPDPKS